MAFEGNRRAPAKTAWALRGLLAVLAAVAMAVVMAPASATAATNYNHVGVFGAAGNGNGQFATATMPQRMAVHEASGKLFVADRGNNRVQVFEPTASAATFDFSIAVTNPVGLAIDQANGNLYVATTSAILRFNPDDASDPASYSADGGYSGPVTGAGAGQIGALQAGSPASPAKGGIAIDPTDSSLLVADVGRNIVQRFNSNGGFVSSFNGCSPELFVGFCTAADRPAFTNLNSLAVTSTGDIIVADVLALSSARIDRFDRNGVFKANLSLNNTPVPNSFMTGANSNAITVATNPETDEVFISSSQSWSFAPVPAHIYQFDGNALVGSFSAPSDFSGYIHGIAARGEDPGRLYVLAASGFGPVVPRIQTYEAITPASVTFGGVSDLTATSATFSGQINPHGSPGSWAFRYRLSGAQNWTQIPATPASAGSGETFLPVSQAVTGLEPNQEYEVRLVGIVGSVESTTAPVTFQTASAAPEADTGTASFISDTSARVYGSINPLSADVTYYFEWGTDTSYGNVTPDPAATLAAARTASIVSAELDGLAPGTEYHYRLVAENEFGQETIGDDRVFETLAQSRAGLRDARGFEMATRLPTGGIGMLGGFSQISEDGSRGLYHTAEGEPAPPVSGDIPHRQFLVERQEDHWSTAAIDLPNRLSINPFGIAKASRDLSSGVAETTVGVDPDDQNHPGEEDDPANVYKGFDLYRVVPGEEPVWLTRSRLIPPGEPQTYTPGSAEDVERPEASAMSVDGSVIAFTSERRLTEDDPFNSGDASRIYKWDDGSLRVVSTLPNGSKTNGHYIRVELMSRDGSRMAWARADNVQFNAGARVYVQRDGDSTVDAGTGWFVAATPDLSRLVVLDAGRLYSVDADNGARQEVSAGAVVRSVLRTSEDARVVTFVSSTALSNVVQSPLGESPQPAKDNLYRAELDENGDLERLQLITVAALGDLTSTPNNNDYSDPPISSTNEDGSVYAFGSTTALTGQPTNGKRQAFVYDAIANSLSCVSCPADGSMPHASDVNADVSRASQDFGSSWYSGGSDKRYVTNDGTFFFSTRTPLVPDDENTSERDVYEYSGGELRLVSRAAWNDLPSTFQGVGKDGENAFIMTSAALDPVDNEPGVRKLYVARVGGGFPAPASAGIPCVGDDCQGQATVEPQLPRLSSEAVDGDGNVSADPGLSQVKFATARRRTVRGVATRLMVRVPGAGRVVVSGSAVKRAGRRAAKSGTVQVPVRLRAKAKRALRNKGTLQTRVRVRFKPTGGKQAVQQVRIKFKWAAARGGGR